MARFGSHLTSVFGSSWSRYVYFAARGQFLLSYTTSADDFGFAAPNEELLPVFIIRGARMKE
jgi:hypothetical protein